MQKRTEENIAELERLAAANNGHCVTCSQVIKIYRYRLNKSHAKFLRAMASEVKTSGVNNVDISTIGLQYSVRSQVTKMRLHGLIARVKNEHGAQIPRHWLITHKGWKFLNNEPIRSKAVVFNNQTLGHDGDLITIYALLGEHYDPDQPRYEEAPVLESEAKVYGNVRVPRKTFKAQAKFKGRDYLGKFKTSRIYELEIQKLEIGKPVRLVSIDDQPHERIYKDIAAFQKDWSLMT